MATAYRVGPDKDIALRLERTAFDPATHRLALQVGARAYRIDVNGVSDDGWLRIDDSAFAVERVLVAHRDEALELVREPVVIRIGVNDIGSPVALEDFARNGAEAAMHAHVRSCVDDIRRSVAAIRLAQPTLRIVLVGMPGVRARPIRSGRR